jgi:hypothetical protein
MLCALSGQGGGRDCMMDVGVGISPCVEVIGGGAVDT